MSEYQGTFKRYEKKYLVTQQQYNALAKVFAARMVPDRFAESTISNIYYDTPDFRLIRRSLDRPAYKEKLRLRTYRTPGADTEAFVEIKKKYDHIVYKRRIAMTYGEAQAYLDGGAAPEQSQISNEIDWFLHFYKGIQPAMCICYDRLALFDKYQPELRVTFDSGIRWRMDDLDLSSGSAGASASPSSLSLSPASSSERASMRAAWDFSPYSPSTSSPSSRWKSIRASFVSEPNSPSAP